MKRNHGTLLLLSFIVACGQPIAGEYLPQTDSTASGETGSTSTGGSNGDGTPTSGAAAGAGGVSCGDLVCDPSENCATCPGDCGSCATCPNGACDPGEDCSNCSQDCGACPNCGDGSCGPGEDCSNCSQDCGACPGCGNGACDPGEDCNNCSQDCGACPGCGNGACDPGEDCNNCSQDCGGCPPPCPNGACDNGESNFTCSDDCPFPTIPGPDPACAPEGSGGPTCGGLPDAYTKAAVNVGYYAYRVKPGVNTNVYTCDNRPIEPLGPLQGFAVQSTRNPNCIDNPPLRPMVNGFVFGYARGTGKSGFVPADALEFVGYSGGACADGPASKDFQVNHNPHDGCKAMPCDGQLTCMQANNPNDGNGDCGGKGLNVNKTVAADDLYLRYAPQSTPFHYLHKDDQVHVLYQSGNGLWWFVEVTSSTCQTLTPSGTRGWAQSDAAYWK